MSTHMPPSPPPPPPQLLVRWKYQGPNDADNPNRPGVELLGPIARTYFDTTPLAVLNDGSQPGRRRRRQ